MKFHSDESVLIVKVNMIASGEADVYFDSTTGVKQQQTLAPHLMTAPSLQYKDTLCLLRISISACMMTREKKLFAAREALARWTNNRSFQAI